MEVSFGFFDSSIGLGSKKTLALENSFSSYTLGVKRVAEHAGNLQTETNNATR